MHAEKYVCVIGLFLVKGRGLALWIFTGLIHSLKVYVASCTSFNENTTSRNTVLCVVPAILILEGRSKQMSMTTCATRIVSLIILSLRLYFSNVIIDVRHHTAALPIIGRSVPFPSLSLAKHLLFAIVCVMTCNYQT